MNILKMSNALIKLREIYPKGNFRLEAFDVDGSSAKATIMLGKKKVIKTFSFNGNEIAGVT